MRGTRFTPVCRAAIAHQRPGLAFASQVAELNSAAINGDEQVLRQGVIELQLTCQTRRG